jgi:hypothetical protein
MDRRGGEMTTRTSLALGAALVGVAACAGPGSADHAYAEWRRHDSVAGTGQILSVVAGGPGFVGGGLNGESSAFWTSVDGIAWQRVAVESFSAPVAEIAAGGPGFVAVTSFPASVWTSADGSDWTRTADQPDLTEGTLLDLASNGSVLVAVGGGFWRSEDGLAWRRTAVPGTPGTQHDVIAGGPGFVAVGSVLVSSMEPKGAIWTSVDGSTWERLPDDPVFDGAELVSIARDGDGLLAAGWRIDVESGWFFSPAIWRSADGTTWTRAAIDDPTMAPASPPPSGPGALQGAMVTHLSRGDAGWIAVGGDGRQDGEQLRQNVALWTSADGAAWQRRQDLAEPELGASSTILFGTVTSNISGDRALIIGPGQAGTSVWVSPPDGDDS